jgi:hypothetical protein
MKRSQYTASFQYGEVWYWYEIQLLVGDETTYLESVRPDSRRNPVIDFRLEHVQWQWTFAENRIMESPDIKFGSELFSSAFSQLENPHLTKLVAEGLGGPSDVAIHFRFDVLIVHGRVPMKKVDHLLTRPMLRVNSGINDQANGPPYQVLKPSVFAVRVLIKTHFMS